MNRRNAIRIQAAGIDLGARIIDDAWSGMSLEQLARRYALPVAVLVALLCLASRNDRPAEAWV